LQLHLFAKGASYSAPCKNFAAVTEGKRMQWTSCSLHHGDTFQAAYSFGSMLVILVAMSMNSTETSAPGKNCTKM